MNIELTGTCSAADIADQLGPIWEKGTGSPLHLVITEDCFLYPSAVTWLTTLLSLWQFEGESVEFDLTQNPSVVAYLTRMDFFKHLGLDGQASGERRTAGGRFLPIQAIDGEDAVYDVVNSILDLLLMHFDNAREILPAVEWALNEITDNIVIHSETPVPGHVFAQFYPKKHILSVAITDGGRGLRQTLSEAHEVPTDRRALELAMERGVTRGVGQGNGIAGTRQILNVNQGRFAIWSGSAHHYTDGDEETLREIPMLPGTGIAMQFDTSRAIDLQKTFIEAVDFTYIEAVAGQISRDDATMRVATESSGYGGRSPALRLRRKISAILPDMDEPLTLDFSGINAVSSSYIDELLGKLIADIGLSEYESSLRIANMAPSVARRANVTIGQRLREMGLDEGHRRSAEASDVDRPAPELEFEGWLAIHPEKLNGEVEAMIEDFCFRWEIERTDEVDVRMVEVFEEMRTEEDL